MNKTSPFQNGDVSQVIGISGLCGMLWAGGGQSGVRAASSRGVGGEKSGGPPGQGGRGGLEGQVGFDSPSVPRSLSPPDLIPCPHPGCLSVSQRERRGKGVRPPLTRVT